MNKACIINDYEICNDIRILCDGRYVIFGCNKIGELVWDVAQIANFDVDGVCDIHRSDGDEWHNRRIETLTEIKVRLDFHDSIIVVAMNDEDINDRILRCIKTGFKYARVITYYAFFLSLYMHRKDNALSNNMRLNLDDSYKKSTKYLLEHTKSYAEYIMRRAMDDYNKSIWIFQPGKVASQTIWNSIQNISIQFHSIAVPLSFYNAKHEELRGKIEEVKRRKIHIVTGVREPISRDISAMFQNSDQTLFPISMMNSNVFQFYGNYYVTSELNTDEEMVARCPWWRDDLNTSFYDYVEILMKYRLDEFKWFDNEIKAIFGINIFDNPFDKKRGFSVIENENIKIFIYKAERLNDLEKELGDFLGVPNYQLVNRNEGQHKIYKWLYDDFKKYVKIPSHYYDFYYKDNSYLNYFYTDEEINAYKTYWAEHI